MKDENGTPSPNEPQADPGGEGEPEEGPARHEDEEAWPRSSVLVEVELPEPVDLSPRLVEIVGSLRVVLLGSYLVPEQTTPEQAQEQFEEECAEALDRIIDRLEEAGADVDARMVFTPDLLDTASRVAREEGCDAILIVRPVTTLDRVLAPLRGPHHIPTIAGFLGSLLVGSDVRVTLLHVREEDEEEGFGTWVLKEVTDLLVDLDVDASRIESRVLTDDDAVSAVLDEARGHDLLVLGESEPGVPDLLFGTFSERVTSEVEKPVFILRRPEPRG